ncbi:hypothetical protein JH06_5512 [Blastocystis sp. subtype 4]|uniref:hypothetical protein n=1 Tax=Blastocystis sp. subtype 4 TaxID=944170 RepID=UPI0007116584|nr:hypothetical protein JH06_5512 [Blastocystis sp. subtype 4]KNB41605.1 hypothetical protein JH06_5512 [Blastocystis sp. subtype 4]|eukprot:XP_014525048.1 hypothetical protein JH06_5512 [Blastocystis sp. subtype 4]
MKLDNTGALYSDNPVDITNGLSNIKLYCNIPCSDQLDRLEYEFRNEKDEPLSFLGNIYLLLTFMIKN